MTILSIAGAAAAGLFLGLLFGASIGAGARSDRDFEEYANPPHHHGKPE